jgi:ADP-ribosyl-[dinitrogen reductase] hydrolase
MMNSSNLQDRTLGALIGLAIGDALGAPVEHLSSQTIARDYPDGFKNYIERTATGLRPGQGTDDTEMAFLVAASLIEKRILDMEDIAKRLVKWGQNHPELGPSTGAGIDALARGVPWYETGQTAVASSGCLPRCAPIALYSSPEQVVEDSLACCRPTHRHPLAIAATVTQNLLLEQLVRGLSWADAFALLEDPSGQYEEYLMPIANALQDGTATPGAVAVLVEALKCVGEASSATTAIETSVTMGGDTDTRAAAAGALAGVRWGLASLPDAWVDGCEAGEEARTLALALFELKLAEDI